MKRMIRRHSRDVTGIIVLFAIGLVTVGVILSRQSAALPSWVPFIGPDVVELHAELSTAQGVLPGQGHTVNLAGVRVGTITGLDLEDGVALVTMQVDREYAGLIHPDASLLLRPRTGLQDMVLEVDPGSGTEAIAEGATIPESSTAPNINVDEVLATLDADTRSYLKLLLAGGGQGLDGQAGELSAGLRRIEPTARDVARIGRALEGRRGAISRVVTAFRDLARELAAHDAELARFVSASATSLGAFAEQEASLRGAVRELPATLREARGALSETLGLSGELEPALRKLSPVASRTGPALEALAGFFGATTPVLADQIRPLTREIRPPVRELTDAAPALGRSASGLEGSGADLADLLDALAYNPAGTEEGYLFWLAWLSHNTGSLFTTRDANGPLRRGLVMLSCQTAGLAEGVAASRPFFRTAIDVTRLPVTEEVC